MARMTKRDREEFIEYLAHCTDEQVRGVYDKERKAGRRAYAQQAKDAAADRGVYLG